MKFLLLLLGVTVVSAYYGSGGYSSEYGGRGRGRGSRRPPRPQPPRPRPPRPSRCPSDWMTFNRPQGPWCVKVFPGAGTSYTAQSMCQAQGAVLTGVQDANERIQLANAARIVNNDNNGGGYLWIDGRRRAQCPNKPSCAAINTFEWTDGHTTGTDGFFWPGAEPNAFVHGPWGVQSCIVMHISVADGQAASWGYPHGSMDDEYCQQTWKMYACGKRPS
ncbi:hypothetical protein CRE_13897 [Caenorhabditis remanei]|uniref:C-type lectin domain-containing protein n=1 Tax=Caenorhabditis remanei TaxID=31234 RepID=E3M8L1_CAERE|nr:hypothetical protein CRE_13897 [Caenorhabditis remanei]